VTDRKRDVMATVLIVDDDPDIRNILTEVLSDAGYDVRAEPNGLMAQRAAVADPPDLILMDIMMPYQDGISTTRRFRDAAETETIPIILLSSSDRMCRVARGALVQEVIGKPFDLDALIDTIQHYCAP
jgi:CheY-like chemotaxis protein